MTNNLLLFPLLKTIRQAAILVLFLWVCIPLISLGQERDATQALVYRPVGTGQTTGHVATLVVFNRGMDTLKVEIGPCLIPATGKYQGYVINYAQEVIVPPFGHADLPLSGYCTNVFKPAVPKNARLAPFEQWVSLSQSLPAPAACEAPGPGFLPLSTVPIDSVWLSYAGTKVPFLYKIDFDQYPASAAAMLIRVVNAIERTARENLSLESVPEKDSYIQMIVQQVFWQYTARLSGGHYPFDYFKDRMSEQVSWRTERPIVTFSDQTLQELKEVSQELWSTFELMGTLAQLTIRAGKEEDGAAHFQKWIRKSVDELLPHTPQTLDVWWRLQDTLQIIDRYLDRETSGYARRILRNNAYTILLYSVHLLDAGHADFWNEWRKVKSAAEKLFGSEFTTDFLDNTQKSTIQNQLQEKFNQYLLLQVEKLDPAATDFSLQIAGWRTILNSKEFAGYIVEETRRHSENILSDKVNIYLEEQLARLENNRASPLENWLNIIVLAQEDWLWDDLDKSNYSLLENRIKKVVQAGLMGEIQRLNPGYREMAGQWMALFHLLETNWTIDSKERFGKELEDELNHKLITYINKRIDRLDTSDSEMFEAWLDILWWMQTDFIFEYMQNNRQEIDGKMKNKIESFLVTHVERLDPTHPDFLTRWGALERILTDEWVYHYFSEEERNKLKGQLGDRLTLALQQQTESLNPADSRFMSSWRMLHLWMKWQGFDAYVDENEKKKLILSLEKNYRQWVKAYDKSSSSEQVDWEEVQRMNATFKIPIMIPTPFPVWIPISGGAAVAGGVALWSLGGRSPVVPPIALDDVVTVSCNSQVNVNVLANDSGEGIRISGFNSPAGISISETGNGRLQINNVGNVSFSFTYVIIDERGNTESAKVIVTVVDDIAPVITCPSDILINCTDDPSPEKTGQANVRDNCDPSPIITHSDTAGGEACTPLVLRTWKATDVGGKNSTCIQTITLIDEQTPVINCPDEAFISTDDTLDPSLTGRAMAVDNCSSDLDISYVDDGQGLDPGGAGVLKRIWSATDVCGLKTSCIQAITINNPAMLSLICPSNRTIDCADNSSPETTGQAITEGDCTGDITVNNQDEIFAGICPKESMIQRIWTAMDECGNKKECTQIITVHDDKAPLVICPPTVNIGLEGDLSPVVTGRASATDNCSAAGAVQLDFEDSTSGLTECAGTGTIVRTWMATDECGNSSSCQQSIRIVDEEPPLIICPFPAPAGSLDEIDPLLTGQARAVDNASSIFDIAIAYEDDFGLLNGCGGILRRKWTATDACGNISICVQDIIISDMEPPRITCPPIVEVECEDLQNIAVTGEPSVSDNYSKVDEIVVNYSDKQNHAISCAGGELIRVWTATDGCQQSDSCEQVIKIKPDLRAPSLACPAEITIACGQQFDFELVGLATAMDDCSMEFALDFGDDESNFSACEGFIIRTWTVVDSCGNAASCEQLIQVDPDRGCVINLFLGSVNQPSSASNADGSITLFVPNTGAALPLNIFLNGGFLFQSDSAVFTIPGLAQGNYDIHITDQNGCLSPTVMITLSAPGGVDPARWLDKRIFTSPLFHPLGLFPAGPEFHQLTYDSKKILPKLQEFLPEHPVLESLPEFDFYLGPVSDAAVVLFVAPSRSFQMEFIQYEAAGISHWSLGGNNLLMPVSLYVPFRGAAVALGYEQLMTQNRLQPFVGIGVQAQWLRKGNSIFDAGRERRVLSDGVSKYEGHLFLSTGFRVRITPDVAFRFHAQWLPLGNPLHRLILQQGMGVDLSIR